MRSTGVFLAALTAALWLAPLAQATESMSVEMWECLGPDGTTLYTNKEKPDCRPKVLQTLSSVPSLPEGLPQRGLGGSLYPSTPTPRDFSYDTPMGAQRNLTQIPTFGQDWYAANQSTGSVRAEVCGMYSEWLQLTQNTRGGLFYGTDPSYGGNPTAKNWSSPSYSFYDNARYVTLSRIFGAGFIPIGCQ